ncbi:MAG: BamA/TamA family outer membrane protein, partial [Bdellovibrionales bacterium]|nr:BamA/TamA family outer membrane protein [Bdellovibrionales bacterium]
DNEPFPLFKRFFPGGINSVRGYDSRELGPKDEQGNEYGGSKQLVANFELLFPLIPQMGLQGVVFYDAGQAFDDDVQIEIGDLRQAVGWGVRWRSPLAPIRIEIGYPIDRESGESSVVTNFSFGSPL